MQSRSEKALLVGDNPFHNISHMSQERTRLRDSMIDRPEHAAGLMSLAIENGANGFMFSVSDTTLSILDAVRRKEEIDRVGLYAIVPYAYEYVKLATQLGGIPGLAKRFASQIIASKSPSLITSSLKGVLWTDPVSLMKTYLMFEINRVRSHAGKQVRIESVLLHEIITDMALALDLDWLFQTYVKLMLKLKITPGFNTCNLPYLVNKLRDWQIDVGRTCIAAPLNSVGFQMNPSKTACEETLKALPEPIVIGISILAAGYLKPTEAIRYVAGLPNVRGVAVGVSKEAHARETFRQLKEKFA